jgi:hypothetical protein
MERTCCSVAVEYGLLLALDRLGVEDDRLRELLRRVEFIPASFELKCEFCPLLKDEKGVSSLQSRSKQFNLPRDP